MTSVFVDTGAFYAQLDAHDAHHARAVASFTLASVEAWTLVTTNAVIYETHALVASRKHPDGRAVALRFLDAIDAGLCEVQRVTPDDERQAKAILRMQQDKGYS